MLRRLTAREIQVLDLVARGDDNLKIAVALGITERTVKAHVAALFNKVNVENRVQLAIFGLKRKLFW